MKTLVQEKEFAIKLRKKGLSYNQILAKVPVAKSSLSLWLKDLPLNESEKRSLRKRIDGNITRGRIRAAATNRNRRKLMDRELFLLGKQQFQLYIDDPLFHSGLSLYWAEGAKRSNMFQFTNSDVSMIAIMILWLERFYQCKRNELGYRLYIHKPYAHEECEKWWAEKMGVPISCFKKTVVKPTSLNVRKRPNYKGCLRIEVPRSTALLRKTKFWINMLVEYYGKE